jgi:histidinol-phosphate aminotransferase
MIQSLERFLAHPGIVDSRPYDARHHDAAWRLQGYDRLMSNECPLPPSPAVLDAARAALEVCNLYPNSGEDVRQAVAAFCGAPPEAVVLGNGSTEVLDVVTRMFVGDGDETVVAVPTYAFFETQTRLCDGTPVLVPLRDDWSLDIDALLAAVIPRTRVVFLCSPNNPTGNGWNSQELGAVLEAGLPTVVDQAYLECGHAESFAPLVERHPNLVVTRTFSKAFGLAALRIGYGVMHPDLADAVLRLRIPFSLSLPALRAAMAALADPSDIQARRDYISGERDRVFAALSELEGVEPYPSEGNFILMNLAASRRSNAEIIEAAQAERILLRAMGSHRLRGTHVRVTLGTTEQNDRFLDLFGRLFAPGRTLATERSA